MKKVIFLITILVASALLACGILKWVNYKKENKNELTNTNLKAVFSLEDEISKNTVWCGTFNLVWNDLKNNIAKQDIILGNQTKEVDNLNKSTFTTNELANSSYYKTAGYQTPELKSKIEKAIKDKFNEESDILDGFTFEEGSQEYLIYVMLKKVFEYKYPFDNLGEKEFNGIKANYFGFEEESNKDILKNVEVILYDSENDKYILKINTKNNDELYFYKGYKKNTFKDIYAEIEKYENKKETYDVDRINSIYIPYINIKNVNEVKSVENQTFATKDGESIRINKAIQTIQLELTEKGGKVKSEAAISFDKAMSYENMDFLFNANTAMFIKEKDAKLPYLALTINNVDEYQK